ncbi:tRNA lysidine(34) synthetase TilS [Corynebacterium sp. LK2510]|uniref:tRNA lysidine(34) synthetase TilS n=1 Tax=Corynebacterium sp. LK2510 TaxID=3110472 RepID=UPI0034CE02FF
MEPFWPRRSPHFLDCRRAVRPFDGPAVIGLSGGADSLALVAAAAAESKDVEAVVIDHGLQDGSAEVAQRAAAAARALGVPATVVAVEVAAGNLEAEARRARYAALREFGVDVWVAHTADDQAETFLLGALRGNPSGMTARSGDIVRPFLSVRRRDTVGACEELGLTWWDDPMNEDSAFRRVAVRTQVIPLLSDLVGGDCVPALAHTADRVAGGNELVGALATTEIASCAELAAQPAVVRRTRIHAWLQGEGINANRGQLDAIEHLVTNWRGQVGVDVARGKRVVRQGGGLCVVRR